MNEDTARETISQSAYLDPIHASATIGRITADFTANELTLKTRVSNGRGIIAIADWAEVVIAPFLAIEFIDTPKIRAIYGDLGGVPFRVLYASRLVEVAATTGELQEERLAKTLARLGRWDKERDRRLVNALRYYTLASRLEAAGQTPWEFMAEMVLNLAKVAEVAFPDSRDAVRAGLRSLDFTDAEIEAWFLPALALRSNLDVAHVSLSSFERERLEALHDYTEQARPKFREMLSRILEKYDRGEYILEPYVESSRRRDADRTIDRLRTNLSRVKRQS